MNRFVLLPLLLIMALSGIEIVNSFEIPSDYNNVVKEIDAFAANPRSLNNDENLCADSLILSLALRYLLVNQRYEQTNLDLDAILHCLSVLDTPAADEGILYVALYYPPHLADKVTMSLFKTMNLKLYNLPSYMKILSRKDISSDLRYAVMACVAYSSPIFLWHTEYSELADNKFAIGLDQYDEKTQQQYYEIHKTAVYKHAQIILSLYENDDYKKKLEKNALRKRAGLLGVGSSLFPSLEGPTDTWLADIYKLLLKKREQ